MELSCKKCGYLQRTSRSGNTCISCGHEIAAPKRANSTDNHHSARPSSKASTHPDSMPLVVSAYIRIFDFKGKSSQKEFWSFFIFNVIFSLIIAKFDQQLSLNKKIESGTLNLAFFVINALPNLSLQVRRLHDTGRSGWSLLILLAPLVTYAGMSVFTLLLKHFSPSSTIAFLDPSNIQALIIIGLVALYSVIRLLHCFLQPSLDAEVSLSTNQSSALDEACVPTESKEKKPDLSIDILLSFFIPLVGITIGPFALLRGQYRRGLVMLLSGISGWLLFQFIKYYFLLSRQ
ncbi:DUF805 domain-containing protein [Burkholderiaceae bacterium DAT-1]|nr:DUF805 domain-containing protein [Burkholderiaceae bacterium DAT-1]